MKKIFRSSILRYIAIALITFLAFLDTLTFISGFYARKLADSTNIEAIASEIDVSDIISKGEYVCVNHFDGLFYTCIDESYYRIDEFYAYYMATNEARSEKFVLTGSGNYGVINHNSIILNTKDMTFDSHKVMYLCDSYDNIFYVGKGYADFIAPTTRFKEENWPVSIEKARSKEAYALNLAREQADMAIREEGLDHVLYYQFMKPLGNHSILKVTLISLLMAVIGLYILVSAGHFKGNEEITLTVFDRIGWAIHGIATIFLIGIATTPFVVAIDSGIGFGNGDKPLRLMLLCLAVAADFLLVGWFLETTVIRFKAKQFIKTTTLYYIIQSLSVPYNAMMEKNRRKRDGLTGVGQIMQDTKAIIAGDKTYVDIQKVDAPYIDFAKDINILAEGKTKAVDEMLKSERMRSELITNVSHDIKTPLTSIISYTDLLSKKTVLDSEASEYLGIISSQSTRLKTLLEDLIEASKASSGVLPVSMEEIQIDILLIQILSEYSDRLSAKNITPVTSIPETVLPVKTDAKHLSRVFCNLLSNVCKYTLEGSRVYISLTQGERTVVTIKNTSSEQLNISPDELKERFSRGDSSRSKEGSGLGLAITESLMELMGGSLDIEIDGDLFKVSVTI